MVDFNPLVTPTDGALGVTKPKAAGFLSRTKENLAVDTKAAERERRVEANRGELESSAKEVENVVNTVAQDISLSFRVEEELSRMVVAVRAVGSDEVIRQFPPEEFITVAKFIASQDQGMVDEDFLKGVLFDQYS